MKKIGIFTGIFLSLIFAGSFVNACSCVAGVSTQERFENSDVVFIGKVTGIDKPAFSIDTSDPNDVSFDVSKVYRGSLDKSFKIQTARDSASCGFDFQEEGEYLVYGTLLERKYETNLCSGTVNLASAGEDIEVLNSLAGDVDEIDENAGEKPIPKMDLSQVMVLALLVLVVALLVIAEIHISRWIKSKKKKSKKTR